jgi:hypothetical protein
MKRVIFIANIPQFDVDSARSIGEITYLFDSVVEVNPFAGQNCLNKIMEKLESIEFDPESDCVALTGPVAAVAILLLAASEMSSTGQVNICIFDARAGGSYKVRTIVPLEQPYDT